MNLSFGAALFVILLGQAPPSESLDTPAGRLKFMKESLAKHVVHPADAPETTYRLQPDPVLRFTNTIGTPTDGAIFLWLDANDRPQAAVQIFQHENGSWLQEFSSLATTPISAGQTWRASQPGVVFRPIPGAPKPAETPEQRLRQIRDLAGGFAADDHFEQKTWHTLRLLTRPFARYGKPGSGVADGALFAYVLTTDPEAYLMIEARETRNGPEWQYAFAPASIYPLKGLWKGKEVWSAPYREAWTDPQATFYVWSFYRQAPLR